MTNAGIPRRLVLTLIIVLALLRWFTWDADFPPISGSLGEYADMGANFFNIRMGLLTGDWRLEVSPLLWLCPAFYAPVYLAAAWLGHNLFAWRVWSLFMGTLGIFLVAVAGERRWTRSVGLLAALLLASDAVWFAYSRCEKQEAASATLLFATAAALAWKPASAFRHGLLVGFIAVLALLTKLNVLIPFGGIFLLVMLSNRRLFSGRFLGGLGAGALGGATLAYAAFMPLLFSGGLVEQLVEMNRFYQKGIGQSFDPSAMLENLVASNFALRSPVHLAGLGAAILVLFRPRESGVFMSALAGIVLATALGPLLNAYYPLRYRMISLPAACCLVAAFAAGRGVPLANGRRDRVAAALAAGSLVMLPAGFLIRRFDLPAPGPAATLLGLGVALVIHRLRLSRPEAWIRGCAVAAVVIALTVGLAQILPWTARPRTDVRRIMDELTLALPPRTWVATNGWWGQFILLGTEFPEASFDQPELTAMLLSQEPNGDWSLGRRPPPPETWEKRREWRAWYGASYHLYVKREAAAPPATPPSSAGERP